MLAQATSGQLNRDFLLHLLGPLQPLLQESAAAIGIALYTLFLQPYAISVFRFMRHHIPLVLTRKQSSGLVEHVDRAFGSGHSLACITPITPMGTKRVEPIEGCVVDRKSTRLNSSH